jgi:hypothetical protein
MTVIRHWEQIINDCKAPGTELNKLLIRESCGLLVDEWSVDNNLLFGAWLTYDWWWFDCCEVPKLVCVKAKAACAEKI